MSTTFKHVYQLRTTIVRPQALYEERHSCLLLTKNRRTSCAYSRATIMQVYFGRKCESCSYRCTKVKHTGLLYRWSTVTQVYHGRRSIPRSYRCTGVKHTVVRAPLPYRKGVPVPTVTQVYRGYTGVPLWHRCIVVMQVFHRHTGVSW